MDKWQDVLSRYFPKTPRKVHEKAEGVAWERDIRQAIPDVKMSEILEGIRMASGMLDATEVIPTPSLLVSWIRRYKWEQRQVDKKLAFDADKDGEKFQVHETIAKWLADTFKGKSDDSADYVEIMAGDKILPTDEYFVNGRWKRYGSQAYDDCGRPIRLVKYSATRARRRVQA